MASSTTVTDALIPSEPRDNYLTHDKGYARRLTNFGKIVNPLGIRTVGEFPNLTETLLKRGMSERVVRKVMGENWVRVLKDVWGE